MLRKMHGLILAVVIGSSLAQSQTTVAGTVVGPDGAPAPNSSVEAFPIQSDGFAGNLTWIKVDDHGNFRLTLHEGRYEIRAKDESEGYPDPNALLSVDPNALFPEVVVSREDISGVQVRLGLKGGILEGDVRDKVTQSPITNAKVTIRDVKKPEAFVEVFSDKAGHFQFTVPNKALQVLATAPGHVAVSYADGAELKLSGGERRSIVIELKHE
jgi:hypothetical protein